jgi:hypothetical protein
VGREEGREMSEKEELLRVLYSLKAEFRTVSEVV